MASPAKLHGHGVYVLDCHGVIINRHFVVATKFREELPLLRLLLGGLPGLSATGLLGGGLLLGLLGTTDGADAGNGVFADISAVAVLSGLAGDTLVDPIQQNDVHQVRQMVQKKRAMVSSRACTRCRSVGSAYLRAEVLGP